MTPASATAGIAGDPGGRPPVRLVFCWTEISGYMAACWRALSRETSIDLRVIAYRPSDATGFDPALMDGIAWTPLSAAARDDRVAVARAVSTAEPEVVVLGGWMNGAYRALARNPDIAARFVLAMDTPWRGTFRQHVAPYALAGFLRRMEAASVPGERARTYARRLGFADQHIFTGLYGIDFDGFAPLFDRRAATAWPRTFVFAGRYVSDKAVDVLVAGYSAYRGKVTNPWPLVTVGHGPLKHLLGGREGIADLGFRQPAELRDVLLGAGVSVLPSRFDPWPLSLVEACAAGLPVIASDACGSTVECLRDRVNGTVVPAGDPDALAGAMAAMHAAYDRLPEMGAQSRELARPYAAERWANRWRDIAAAVSRYAGP